MDNIYISIIVPAYNIEQYIGRCLESILQQTYRFLEVIVVDDGSTDNTGKILDQYAVKEKRVVAIHKENGGVSSARLAGLKKATGMYIGFVDGDDIVEPTMFERLVKNALAYSAEISHCGYKMIFPNGKVDYYYNTGKIIQQNKIKGLEDLISGQYIEPALYNKLFHKKLFEQLIEKMSMYKDIRINEDLLMNYFLFKQSKLSIYEDICLYHYILRKGSAATSKLNEHKLKDPIYVMKIILEDSEDVPEIGEIIEERLIKQMINVSSLSLKEQKELVKPFRKTIRSELRIKSKEMIRKPYISKTTKIKAIWVSTIPFSYRWIHNLYTRITGLDKKYEIE